MSRRRLEDYTVDELRYVLENQPLEVEWHSGVQAWLKQSGDTIKMASEAWEGGLNWREIGQDYLADMETAQPRVTAIEGASEK